jgi:DNA polymerase-3 subunit epsilon
VLKYVVISRDPSIHEQLSLDDPGVPLPLVTFCVLDLETTGASAEHDRITEIGAAKFRGGEQIGTFKTFVNPECEIPPAITVLTGITQSMVMAAPSVGEILPTLLEFIGDSVIVAHNARFDVGFLNAALLRNDREPLTNRVLDTVALARRVLRGSVPDCKLATLAKWLRLPHQPSHRALDDALATADLLHVLIERSSGYGVVGLDDLSSLTKLDQHPQASKLRLTEDIPRLPGVYLFLGENSTVLYVGKATNLRQRVRSYFSTGETRRKVGAMLRQTKSIAHIATPDALTAAIYEARLIARLLPQYNRAGTRSEKYRYLRVTKERVVDAEVCHYALAVMTTAGLYETSGDWLFDIGLPGKSGISGGIVTVSPGKGGLGTFAPPLDAAGNSVKGQLVAKFLSEELGMDLFVSKPAV